MGDIEKRSDYWAPLLTIAVASIAIMLLPWHGSLWLDETITAWITSASFNDVWQRSLEFQGQSPLYFSLVWLLRRFLSASEWHLRIISIVSAAGCLFLLYTITHRLTGRLGACCATLLLASLNLFVVSAVSARPYALALFFTLLAFHRILFRPSLQRRDLWWALGWLLCAFYVHYLFSLAAIVLAADLLMHKAKWRIHLRTTGLVALVGACAALPGVIHLVAISKKADLYSFATQPSLLKFILTVFPPELLACVGSAALVSCLMIPKALTVARLTPKRELAVVAIWWIIPPVVFLLMQCVLGGSLFVPRLFLWAFAGAAIASASLFANYLTAKAQRIAFAIVALFALQRSVDRHFVEENWRSVAAELSTLPSTEPVVVYAGLIESESPQWLADSSKWPYLTSPLQYYQVPQSVLPIGTSPQGNLTIWPNLQSHDHFQLVVAGKTVQPVNRSSCALVLDQLKALGFEPQGVLGDVECEGIRLFSMQRAPA